MSLCVWSHYQHMLALRSPRIAWQSVRKICFWITLVVERLLTATVMWVLLHLEVLDMLSYTVLIYTCRPTNISYNRLECAAVSLGKDLDALRLLLSRC
jgi:hypothetical protein